MNRKLVDYLIDPETNEPLSIIIKTYDGEEILEGDLVSPSGNIYPITNGIPRFVGSNDPGQIQTADSFGYKWTAQSNTYDSANAHDTHHRWLVEKYGFSSRQAMYDYFSTRKRVLDAGCGNGLSSSTWLLCKDNLDQASFEGAYIGVDISNAVDVACQRLGNIPNTFFIQADLVELPFSNSTFDTIFSEGVLHHTPSTEMALKSLVQCLEMGGEIMFYVHKKKSPIREFTDDHVRSIISSMPPGEAWEALKPLTKLGQALSDLNVEVDVPEDIPFLGIRAGRIDVQRLIYWNVAKLFWNADISFDDNHHVNFDWYHPKYAHRQTEEEVRRWCVEAGLSITHFHAEESGFTVRAVRKNEI